MAKKRLSRGNDIEIIQQPQNSPQIYQLNDILKSLPPDLVDNLPLIVNRINGLVAFYNAISLTRLNKLMGFITKAEEVLFDEDRILNMETDKLLDVYKQCKSAINEILESSRKIAYQVSTETNKQVDDVYRLLESLDPDTIQEIKDIVSSMNDSEE